jgi:hypothetical protein
MVTWIQNFINVESSDPDDARRRRLLNILLAGIIGSAVVGGLFVALYVLITNAWEQGIILIFLSSIIFILGGIGIILLNRRYGPLAAVLFLLLLTFTFS